MCQENKTQPKYIWTMDQGVCWYVKCYFSTLHLCIWYSNNIIAPCYPESVANEVLSTVGGVRFIKWAQDSLVSFVKCEPPSILLSGGDKRYNALKDVLAPICIVFSVVVNLEWHLRLRVMLEDPTSKPLKSSLTLKGRSFLHSKRQKSW